MPAVEMFTTSTSITLPSPTDGRHVFYVRAQDKAGLSSIWGSVLFRTERNGATWSCWSQR